jgi:hypothetical protein
MTMRYSHLAPGGNKELIGVLDVQRHGTPVAPLAAREGNARR